MASIIAVSGLAGVGKTTATEFMAQDGVGLRVYAGQAVLDEVIARGLPPNAESEKSVRMGFREKFGPAAMAQLAAPHVMETLKTDTNVLLDAVLSPEKLLYYEDQCGINISLLMIEAPFDVRALRLSQRGGRKLTAGELRDRDVLENQSLGIARLLPKARKRLVNETSLEEFRVELQRFVQSVC
jgi:dephospho-CoA kinase